jgi:CheY-like chemotaxis protein
MDGLNAARRIRENPNKATLPIIAMTAHALKTEFDKSIAAGMNDHITKPIDPIKLYQSILKNVLGKNIELTKQESTKSHIEINISGIDTVDGMNRVRNKKALYEKLLFTFASNYNESAIQINNLVEEKNQQELERYFHSLAGVAGNVGAKELYSKAYQLSIDIKNDFQSVNQSTYTEIAELTNTLIHNINEYLEKVRGNNIVESSVEIDVQSSLIKLKELLTQNDAEAESIVNALTSSSQISDSDREVYLKIGKLLGVFEFDEALKLLMESTEVSA